MGYLKFKTRLGMPVFRPRKHLDDHWTGAHATAARRAAAPSAARSAQPRCSDSSLHPVCHSRTAVMLRLSDRSRLAPYSWLLRSATGLVEPLT
jgi:hypothetical protein